MIDDGGKGGEVVRTGGDNLVGVEYREGQWMYSAVVDVVGTVNVVRGGSTDI